MTAAEQLELVAAPHGRWVHTCPQTRGAVYEWDAAGPLTQCPLCGAVPPDSPQSKVKP